MGQLPFHRPNLRNVTPRTEGGVGPKALALQRKSTLIAVAIIFPARVKGWITASHAFAPMTGCLTSMCEIKLDPWEPFAAMCDGSFLGKASISWRTLIQAPHEPIRPDRLRVARDRALLPNKPRGVPRVDDRRTLNGIFWVLRSGAPWRDLPERYGPRTTCYNRSIDGGRRACGTGLWTPSAPRTTALSR